MERMKSFVDDFSASQSENPIYLGERFERLSICRYNMLLNVMDCAVYRKDPKTKFLIQDE